MRTLNPFQDYFQDRRYDRLPPDPFGYLSDHGFESDYAALPVSMQGRIAIVGMPGAGKKTLCNSLYGWQAVDPSSESARSYGLFTLVDLPSSSYDAASVMYRLESASLIIFVIDGKLGLNSEIFNWVARLRSLDAAMLIVFNKVDMVAPDELDTLLKEMTNRLARPVIPLVAYHRDAVHEHVLGATLSVCPQLAVPLATEIPALRNAVARHTVSQYAVTAMSLSIGDTLSREDPSTLVGIQLRMLKDLALVYGYRDSGGFRQRMGLTLAMQAGLKQGLRQVARFKMLDGWIGAGMVNAAATFIVGYVALLIYGSQFPNWFLRFTPQGWKVQRAAGAAPGSTPAPTSGPASSAASNHAESQ